MVTATNADAWNACLHTPLQEEDPALYALIQQEFHRQQSGLELIASENFTSLAVMEANGSCLTNKYSEGLPGARYYGGNEYIDHVERLCQQRALEAFNLDPQVWGVNVQPYSGSPANFATFTGILQPHDRIMGLDLPSGGHLTHGYQTAKKKISATSVFFESMPYQVDMKTGLIDYEALERNAKLFRPRLIICGASAYPREFDYVRFRKIADDNGAMLMCDMAHFSGLVAGKSVKSPFELCDIVTTTTHKTLRGPRAGMIFFRKVDRDGKPTDFEQRINMAVFPGCQGGPHNNTIAAVALALKQAAHPTFSQYTTAIIQNARRLSSALQSHGYKIVTDGTDNHIVLWDLRPLSLTGNKLEKLCDLVHITVNKNAVHGDTSALSPGGIRLGTPALTSRSVPEEGFVKVAEFLHRTVQICLKIQEMAGSKLLKDFVAVVDRMTGGKSESGEELKVWGELEAVRKEVGEFAMAFPMPGRAM